MKIKQLSVFMENQKGHLKRITTTLKNASINIQTLTLADTKEYGILRLIIKDWEKAKEVLEKENFTVNVLDVMAIEVPDHPGGLCNILNLFAKHNFSIEYMYAFSLKKNNNAVMIIRLADIDNAEKLLLNESIEIIRANEFYNESQN